MWVMPRGMGMPTYPALAPPYRLHDLVKPLYEAEYQAQLMALNASKVWGHLYELADGHEPVLLCWERPPFNDQNWCHRRMVARWLETALPGLKIPEFEVEPVIVPQLDMWGSLTS